MSRKYVVTLGLVVLLSSLLYVRFNPVKVKAPIGYPVHNLNTGLNYTTIQEAVDAVETLDGHTIFVEEGTYYEHIVVSKTVSLVGENRSGTIIDGEGNGGAVILVVADNVTICNFTVRNSGVSDYPEIFITFDGGIALNFVEHCTLKNNIVTDNNVGILIAYGGNHTLRNNEITGCNFSFGVTGEEPLHFWNDIDMSNTVDGKPILYLVQQHNVCVNTSTYPEIGYLALVNSTNVSVEDHQFRNNLQGTLVAYTRDSRISNVTMSHSLFGFYVHGSLNCSLIGNMIEGHTLYGSKQCDGVFMANSAGLRIAENSISNCNYGMIIDESPGNSMINNNISSNRQGIWFIGSPGCHVLNNIFSNHRSSAISGSGNCLIAGNTFLDNRYGIINSVNNTVYHNNFMNSTEAHVWFSPYGNVWNTCHPLAGNYWDDFNGTDSDHDGVGDTPYIIDVNNTDPHPLMGMFSDFNATSEYHVQTICNSTISDFQFNGTAIFFNVSGDNDTAGFCRICIPKALMNNTYKIFVNGTEVTHIPLPCSNSTHSYLYFTYSHSAQEVVIIPEFPSFLLLPLFMTATLLAVIAYRKKLSMT